MKAFLLAAGNGTRMRPLTETVPKCLLPVGRTPMLEIWLHWLHQFRIEEVLINLHAHADSVRSHLAAHPAPLPVRVVEEAVLLGSAGTVRENQEWIGNEPDVLICYADVLTNFDLESLIQLHRREAQLATLALYQVTDPERCGVAEIRGNRIAAFHEKPTRPLSNLAFTGIMVLSAAAIPLIPIQHPPTDIGGDLLPLLAGQMAFVTTDDFVMDIGTKSNYWRAQQLWPGLNGIESRAPSSPAQSRFQTVVPRSIV